MTEATGAREVARMVVLVGEVARLEAVEGKGEAARGGGARGG